MPFVEGFLSERVIVGGPDQGLPRPPARPDQGLPGIEGPVDPGWGIPLPPVIDNTLPPAPSHPIALPPTYPVDPDYGQGFPLPPHVWPLPPRPAAPNNDLPVAPVYPTHPIYRPEAPNNDLPLPPGAVWPPLPPALDQGEYMVICWIPGIGYRWTVIDSNLKPDQGPVVPPARPPHVSTGPVPAPGRPDQGLPPTEPTPRR
jgi:hypothetical protein